MERNVRAWLRLTLCAALVTALIPAVLVAEDDGAYETSMRASDLPSTEGSDFAESPMGRIEWMKERFGGELSDEFRAGVLAEVAKIQSGQGNVVVGDDWTSLGPVTTTRFQNGVNIAKHDTGRLRAVLPHPTDPETVYVLTSGGGLWRTSDFSSQNPEWDSLTDNLAANAGGDVAFGRTSSVLYLGTGDPFDLGVGGTVYKSADGGDNWIGPVALPFAQRVLDIKVDTSQGSTTADDIVMVGTDVGLYRSTDGGATFSYVGFPIGSAAPTIGVILGLPQLGQEIWSIEASSAGWLATVTDYWLCSNCYESTNIFYSGDQGATWARVPDANFGGFSFTGRTTLAASVSNPSTVYALSAFITGGFQEDVYKSTDGGMTWAGLGVNSGGAPTNPNLFNSNLNIMAGQAWYNHNILVDPEDENTVYVGGQLGSAVSTDGGATWSMQTSWLGKYNFGLASFGSGLVVDLPYVHADHHCGAIGTAGGTKRIYFGGDGGLFYSEDGGKSWQDDANQGVVTALIYALTAGTLHSDNTLIGLQDNGTRFRVAGTSTWTGSIGGDGFGVGWSQANDDYSMGSLYFLDIRRWAKNPPNNQSKYDRLLSTSNLAGPGDAWANDSYFVTPIATPTPTADPTGGVFFTNTRNYLLRTNDGGDSWSAIWDGTGQAEVVRSVSHGIGLSPNDLDHILLAGSGGNAIVTDDGGSSWSTVLINTAGLPAWPGFNASAGIASNNTTMYMVSESTDTTAPHVARSADGGATWADATGDLPKLPINKVVVDPNDASGNTVYVGTWIGVYMTSDGGTSWARVGNGLPYVMASDLYFPPDWSFLRISTYGRGVWEMPLN